MYFRNSLPPHFPSPLCRWERSRLWTLKKALQEHKDIKYKCRQSGLWAPKCSGRRHVTGARDIKLMPRGEEDTVTQCGCRVSNSLLHPRAHQLLLLWPSCSLQHFSPPHLGFLFWLLLLSSGRSHMPDILSLNSPEEFSSLSIYVGRGLGSLTGGSLFYSC